MVFISNRIVYCCINLFILFIKKILQIIWNNIYDYFKYIYTINIEILFI
jgi:hypothetical protein